MMGIKSEPRLIIGQAESCAYMSFYEKTFPQVCVSIRALTG